MKAGLIGLALLLSAASANAEACVPFEWGPITAGELTIEKGAVIVRVNVEGVGKSIPLQLDTGSATTELHSDAVTAAVAAAGTQARTISIAGWSDSAIALPIKVRATTESSGTTAGTLGTNAFPNGFVLDLKHQRICDATMLKARAFKTWQALTLVNGSPVIEAKEVRKPIKLLLDTGSSGFTLLSTSNLSATVRTAKPVRNLKVPSFGRMLNVSERTPRGTLMVMGKALRLTTVYGLEDPDIEGMLKSAGLTGLLGLRPFADRALAFDLPGKRIGFGILSK